MSVNYGNAPIPQGMCVWVKVRMKPKKTLVTMGLDSNYAFSGNDMKKVWEYLKKQVPTAVAGFSYPDEVGICIRIDKTNAWTQNILSEIVSMVAVKANQIHFAANPIGFASGNVKLISATGKLLITTDMEG